MKLHPSIALAALLATKSVVAKGMNCRGSHHCNDHKHETEDAAKTLALYISEIPNDAIIQYDRLIACTVNICARLNWPWPDWGLTEGQTGAQVRRMAEYIAFTHKCDRCGKMAVLYPGNKNDIQFKSGSLQFDYAEEAWRDAGCGTSDGLCNWIAEWAYSTVPKPHEPYEPPGPSDGTEPCPSEGGCPIQGRIAPRT